jgi:hypothetical protein
MEKRYSRMPPGAQREALRRATTVLGSGQLMKPHIRAVVAAIALSHATGKRVSSIYDHVAESPVTIDATASGDAVVAFDFDNRCAIRGILPDLYHHGKGCLIRLTPTDNQTYDGYDFGEKCRFEALVIGHTVELYDHGDRRHFSFSG